MSEPDPDFGDTPMTAVRRLGAVSREYEKQADAYRDVALAAAAAEAEHKTKRAQAILRIKAEARGEGERVSHAEAETRAEADDEVATLYRDRLITAAKADAHREKLRQLREQVGFGRTAVASERETDRIHAGGWSGAP